MTEFLDKDAVMAEIKRRISNLETNAAKHARKEEYMDAADCQKWKSPLEHLAGMIDKGCFKLLKPGPITTQILLGDVSKDDLIRELLSRQGVNSIGYLTLKEGALPDGIGTISVTILTVADYKGVRL